MTTKIDFNNLQSGGFIKEIAPDKYTVRLRVPGGRLPIDRLKKIAEAAEKFGGEYVHLSVRQSIELVGVNISDFDSLVDLLSEADQKPASCGARIRVPVACGGCEYNPNGLVDTQKSALEVDRLLFGMESGAHKFKVAFSGCPIDCPKTSINDIGFTGGLFPALDTADCISCGLCAKNCEPKAITIGDDELPKFDCDKCNYCGDCTKVCPTDCWQTLKAGYTVRIGGKWGKHPLIGSLFANFLPPEMVIDFIREVFDWYREAARGEGRKRLGDILLNTGTEPLAERLREKYSEYIVDFVPLPQIVRTGLEQKELCHEPVRS